MLNIGKLTAVDGANYYLRQVAPGVEDYYTGQGEAVGYWTGSAAVGLGLEGEVDGDDLRAVLAGRDPREPDEPLGSWKSGRKVLAFDVVLRAPKSVSVLWGLSDEATAGTIRAAHDVAVRAAVDYLEDAAAWSRRGAGGHESVAGSGFVAAAFRHRTSRAGDPLLHTHVLVANMTRAIDDQRWRTLDSRRGLYAHAKTAGYLYQAQLRHELTRTLGVAWQTVTNGYADIDGIDDRLLDEFSQRRRAIVKRMTERGESSARAAQAATLDTRRPKQNIDGASLAEQWAARAAEHGVDTTSLGSALHPARVRAGRSDRYRAGVRSCSRSRRGDTAHVDVRTPRRDPVSLRRARCQRRRLRHRGGRRRCHRRRRRRGAASSRSERRS